MPTYTNRVHDTVAADFVRWDTASPDKTGSSYPGPGTFGVDTSDYCVESVTEAAGTGEANTASNVGTGTVGLFRQKTGVDLEFRELISVGDASNVLTLQLSGGGTEVELQLEHQLAQTLGGGANTVYGVTAGNVGTVTGTGNTVMGRSAGAALTTGSSNEIIGNGAGISVTTGSANTLIGSSAAASLTTGDNNIILGSSSGGVLITGSNNIILGYNINNSTDRSDYINIADILQADIDATVANQRVRLGGSAEISGQTSFALLYNQNADTVPVLGQTTTGTNGASTRNFVGNRTPIGNVTGNPGDTYTRVDTTNSEFYVHQGSVADNTSWMATAGGGGQTNTASNVGSGTGVFKQKTGVDLEFKSILSQETTVIVVSSTTDEVTLDTPHIFLEAVEGDSNTFVGNGSAANGSPSGADNTCLGTRALAALTTGNRNIAMGSEAADGLNTGSDNIILGTMSGGALTSGTNNTVLGNASGGTLVDGTYNILIGDSVDTPATNTSNHMNIGDVLFGSVGTGAHDDVRIGGSGVVSELVQLQVEGPVGRADTTALVRFETTGTNGAKVYKFVGDRTPVGNVTGSPGDQYHRVGGASSDMYIHNGATADNTSWVSTTAAASGEANTASNVGTGVGVFKQKTVVDLEFKSLLVDTASDADNIMTLTGGTNEISITFPGIVMDDNGASTGNNVGLGIGNLVALTTGYDNTALGGNTGKSLTTGNGNVMVGSDILLIATTASNNTVVGTGGGPALTTGSTNTLIGQLAGTALTTGNGNVLIGTFGGTLTSGDDNILIGSNVDVPSNSTSDMINIGDLYYGDISANKARVGGSGSVTAQAAAFKVEAATTDTSAIMAFETTSTNGEISSVFVGDRTPVGNVTGSPGDIYVRVDGITSDTYLHVGSTSNNTDWVSLRTGPVENPSAAANTAGWMPKPMLPTNAGEVSIGSGTGGGTEERGEGGVYYVERDMVVNRFDMYLPSVPANSLPDIRFYQHIDGKLETTASDKPPEIISERSQTLAAGAKIFTGTFTSQTIKQGALFCLWGARDTISYDIACYDTGTSGVTVGSSSTMTDGLTLLSYELQVDLDTVIGNTFDFSDGNADNIVGTPLKQTIPIVRFYHV